MARWQVVHQMLGGGAHTVAAGFAADEDQIGAVQIGNQGPVQLGGGVVRVGHFGLQGAVMLGPRVAAFADFLRHGQMALFPAVAGGLERRVNRLAPAADFAMHRPDHQRVASAPLQFVQIRQCAGQHGWVFGRKTASAHLRRRDRRERRDWATSAARAARAARVARATFAARVVRSASVARAAHAARAGLPERRVRDVKAVVRVQRQRDGGNAVRALADQVGQPQHVGVRTRHRQSGRDGLAAQRIDRAPVRRQVAKIVLRVDQQKLDVLGRQAAGGHGGLPFRVQGFNA